MGHQQMPVGHRRYWQRVVQQDFCVSQNTINQSKLCTGLNRLRQLGSGDGGGGAYSIHCHACGKKGHDERGGTIWTDKWAVRGVASLSSAGCGNVSKDNPHGFSTYTDVFSWLDLINYFIS